MNENVQEIFAPLSYPISDSYINQRLEKIKIYIQHLTNAIKNENINKVKFYINKLKEHKCSFNNFYKLNKMTFSLYILIISLKYIKNIKIFKCIYHCGIFNINAIIWQYYNYKIFKYLSKTYLLDEHKAYGYYTHLVHIQKYKPTNENMRKIKLFLSNGIKPKKTEIIFNCKNTTIHIRNDLAKIYIFNMFKQRTIYILAAT